MKTPAHADDAAAREARSARRRQTMEGNRASNHAEAEAWDLDYWQRQGPEARLSALVAIHRDVALVEASRSDERR